MTDDFLVVAPTGRDADVTAQVLRSADIAAVPDADGTALFAAIAGGTHAGAILTDDALSRLDQERLLAAIAAQAPWSDFPFILLSKRGEPRRGAREVEAVANVTLLERPLHPASLVSAARAALRARQRQRLAARHFEDREKARAELRDLADTLEAKVEARTRELAAANDRLTAEIAERERAEARLVQAQKMEAIGQLTGGIAHDFNNLLTAVIGSLDLLLRRTDDEKIRRLASMALQAGERGATLTAQLLSFSRRQHLSPVPVEPNQVVASMADLLARSIGAAVTVELDLADDVWRAMVDPTQLEVVLLNLAINARDAMPSGGVVRIATRNLAAVPDALTAELNPGAYVAIEVADTGAGMTPAVLARAFEPFFTTKGQGKGTGLGLAQVYGFARQSGGTVRIVSAENEGTVITLYLPRTTEVADPVAIERLTQATGSRQRILVVDDDNDVRGVAAQMIEEIGYQVVAAASGTEALTEFGRASFDLVLTDVVMPGMSGVDLARRIRAVAPAMPLLFASGYADVATFGDELAAETVLKKPYRIGEVAARIGDALSAESTQ
ncbi:response regulator [Sphingomonas sp. PvP018]|uniref:response regulator n=1 Tax=Sphingomonas sp. PvP018 TaxID=2817852 RepID=UPI001AE79ED5|nr:response regulator [Sphingomonas sp. PvP018]MBP2513322.1 signal transduction histidine kinase/ActR/RegA family two-component response regulator [Sphingomonas sp. PvP018]